MSDWSIHHVAIRAPQLRRTRRFFTGLVGLPETGEAGTGIDRPGDTILYGSAWRGVHAVSPDPRHAAANGLIHNPAMGGYVALTVQDLDAVARRLDRASIPWSEDAGRLPGLRQICAYDPSFNLIAFNQAAADRPDGAAPPGVQPWEAGWGWGIHHVNLMAHDVRETAGFLSEIAGLPEGRWTRPDDADERAFSIDPAELTIFPLGDGNRGLHIIRPDIEFGRRNGFLVNPSIGGHPAILVPDIHAVMRRMDEAGWHYDDAGVYAMRGMHQIYTWDPAMNVIEINQQVAG